MSLSDLDDLGRIRSIDSSGMIEVVLKLPEQCEKAAEAAREWSPKAPLDHQPNAIIVAGLGGSALAGDMVAALHSQTLHVPMLINRDYHLPAYVGPNTLVICASYSGGSEEAISAYAEARGRGARVVSVTSGGKLGKMAEDDGSDILKVPAGLPSRSAIGYMLAAQMFLIEKLALAEPVSHQLAGAIDLLKRSREEWRPESPSDDNDAKLLARELHERIPLFYGYAGMTGAIAYRWKSQCNENAKIHAFAHSFPEMNRNEMTGWELANLESDAFAAVFIRDPEDKSSASDKSRIISTLIPRGLMVRDIQLRGANPLEKLLWGIYLGDAMSVYLAITYDVDPMCATAMERLKAEIAG